jgi:hypothetical protein
VASGLERAVAGADRHIHDNDVERLKQLAADCPALLSWKGDDEHNGLLGVATGAYGDAATRRGNSGLRARRAQRC